MQTAQRIAALARFAQRRFPRAAILVGHTMPNCVNVKYGNHSAYVRAIRHGKANSDGAMLYPSQHPYLRANPEAFQIGHYLRKALPPDGPKFKFVNCTGFIMNRSNIIMKYMHAIPSGSYDCVHHNALGENYSSPIHRTMNC